MTAGSRVRVRRGGRPRTARAAACAAVLAALVALATGCREEAVPAWGYPELGARLGSLSRAVEEGCAGAAPAGCGGNLDRLDALAGRAFAEVLDRRLLDQGCLRAREEVRRARRARLAAAERARAGRDPRHAGLGRAVAVEHVAYRRLLAALERVRAAPPPGEGADPL
ncbi:hypothetical protein ACWFQ8_13745 [Streptomyces sp. NPDC055254]